MSKPKTKKTRVKVPYLEPNVTLEEFIDGESLTCLGSKLTPIELTYRVGVGVFITQNDEELPVVDTVTEDADARRLYHNMTRRPPGQEATDGQE